MGCHSLLQGIFPTQGVNPVSCIAGRLFTDWTSREVPFINLVKTFIANKSPYSQSYGFSSSHVGMWELNHKEVWAWKNWCFQWCWRTLESPLDCEEIKSVSPKGNQHWIFIGKTETEAEAPILWPPDAKSRLIGKDPDARKDWRQEEKGTTEDRMVNSITDSTDVNLSQLGDGEGQVSLACCSLWGHKESDTT